MSSNKGGKQVGSAPSLDELGAAMSSRYATPPPQEQQEQEETPASAPPQRTSTTADHGTSEMTRRSWFLPTEVADALSAAAGRLHHASHGRIPKSQALAALIQAGLEQEATVAHRLECDESHQ